MIETVISWVLGLVAVAFFYGVAYALLRGYIAYMQRLDIETLTKQFKIKCALLVPFVVGLFALVVYIAREWIKSMAYSDNASAGLTSIAVVVALFVALILHTYFTTSRRSHVDFSTRETIKDLKYKIDKLESENTDLRYELRTSSTKEAITK